MSPERPVRGGVFSVVSGSAVAGAVAAAASVSVSRSSLTQPIRLVVGVLQVVFPRSGRSSPCTSIASLSCGSFTLVYILTSFSLRFFFRNPVNDQAEAALAEGR